MSPALVSSLGGSGGCSPQGPWPELRQRCPHGPITIKGPAEQEDGPCPWSLITCFALKPMLGDIGRTSSLPGLTVCKV